MFDDALDGVSSAAGCGSDASGSGGNGPRGKTDALARTVTPEGELALLHEALCGSDEGIEWMRMVKAGLDGDALHAELAQRPLVKTLAKMVASILVPRPDNFTPPERTPWGGRLIIDEMKSGLHLRPRTGVVGESWEISGHPSFPNIFELTYEGRRAEVSLPVLETLFPGRLLGEGIGSAEHAQMPFLVKFLNSGGWLSFKQELASCLCALDAREGAEAWRTHVGVQASLVELLDRDYDGIHHGLSLIEMFAGKVLPEGATLHRLHCAMLEKNLSVQVHPTANYAGLKKGEHSKTEAWVIVDAEEGAGIYLGLKDGVSAETFEGLLREGGDVTALLNFIPVCAGDVFFIPAGTMHAIGAGILLVEPQETSETTYRVFDYGRRDASGGARQLHVEAAMSVTLWDGPHGAEAVSSFKRKEACLSGVQDGAARVEQLVNESVFETQRVTFAAGDRYARRAVGAIAGCTVVKGLVVVRGGGEAASAVEIPRGQSFLVPACLEGVTMEALSGDAIVLLTTVSCASMGEIHD
jgi:mannose-6-phosphate isomerase class I